MYVRLWFSVYCTWLVLKHSFRLDLVWPLLISAFVDCYFISFFWLRVNGAQADISGNNHVLSVENRVLMSPPSYIRAHFTGCSEL